ncbi:TetR/AcrR family transcriptional regulator [Actinomadura madurae]|uniref:TetR/AcrR family transcriptional regulator n=1 Tax=Actinomadura madurae TaxID=1993 RepID=UPI0020D25D36|nr:TetR/AcrR family transcriptional regulator [Actinomadura madurae]MCP9953428.1 TetR/AcrR family transcriptional regulator [Actinomadura madurae]MCP9970190.1 TetR/AcrR family transcriptional regulator [Actinomadura madurae]MCP9982654.1 TetR/AcrR family transcriptional regulator [Actinomadura madurae]MCQ0005799.1 TetR/AcrR family transcriptional regulator [Actinomadura madurae]
MYSWTAGVGGKAVSWAREGRRDRRGRWRSAAGSGFERRRAETRGALVRAARLLLAESGDTSASIQAIAERGGVGFGSFYNHFESKTALFEAAVMDALEEFGRTFDERLTGIDDPAELLSAGFRLSARMAESLPELMQVLRRRGLGHLHEDNGLTSRALRDLRAGMASPSPSGSPRHPLGPSVAAVFGWSWASGWPRVG